MITKTKLLEKINKDFIVRDFISKVSKTSEDKQVLEIKLFYNECIITFTIVKGHSIWWSCEGYIYYLRAEHFNDIMQDLIKEFYAK